ncbi:Uncharacterised protein [Mycobacteroides abscessus subsp. abscessus]|nr:Uncharacterised protein [Mycobacteroides abscessus subsp. abscessus]
MSRSVDSSTSSCSLTVPATIEVRPPWVVTAWPCFLQTFRISATSSAVPGRIRTLAVPR